MCKKGLDSLSFIALRPLQSEPLLYDKRDLLAKDLTELVRIGTVEIGPNSDYLAEYPHEFVFRYDLLALDPEGGWLRLSYDDANTKPVLLLKLQDNRSHRSFSNYYADSQALARANQYADITHRYEIGEQFPVEAKYDGEIETATIEKLLPANLQGLPCYEVSTPHYISLDGKFRWVLTEEDLTSGVQR